MKFCKFLVSLVILCVSFAINPAMAQENSNYDNPGYFETPGFIALGASFTPRNRKSMEQDNTPVPYIWGAYNILQSEYGNLSLVAGLQYSRPSRKYTGAIPYEMESDFVSADLGLGYFTAAKTWNFYLGAGYSVGWLKMRQYADNGYSAKYNEAPHGLFYFIGGEYALTKDGLWGIFVILSGRELKSTIFEYDDKNGFAGHDFINVSNQVVSVGVIYHF